MVEVYRDRLKLDVMVVNAFNQILTIQPDNLQAVDALAAQYEAMGRWPELIAILRKKAAVVAEPEREGGAAPAGRQPVPGEVLQPGRGDQGVRGGAGAGSRQRAGGRATSSRCTRSAATGTSWSRSPAARSTRIDDAERAAAAARIEVARLASEKLKKPAVSIELWREVLGETGRRRGGAGRAGEALRAREGVGRARRGAGAAGGAADPPTSAGRAC